MSDESNLKAKSKVTKYMLFYVFIQLIYSTGEIFKSGIEGHQSKTKSKELTNLNIFTGFAGLSLQDRFFLRILLLLLHQFGLLLLQFLL